MDSQASKWWLKYSHSEMSILLQLKKKGAIRYKNTQTPKNNQVNILGWLKDLQLLPVNFPNSNPREKAEV